MWRKQCVQAQIHPSSEVSKHAYIFHAPYYGNYREERCDAPVKCRGISVLQQLSTSHIALHNLQGAACDWKLLMLHPLVTVTQVQALNAPHSGLEIFYVWDTPWGWALLVRWYDWWTSSGTGILLTHSRAQVYLAMERRIGICNSIHHIIATRRNRSPWRSTWTQRMERW